MDMNAGPEQGLEHRYDVKKVNDPDGKHDHCRYFVLDPKHDPISRLALRVYADNARTAGLDTLADDITAWIDNMEHLEQVDKELIRSTYEAMMDPRPWHERIGGERVDRPE